MSETPASPVAHETFKQHLADAWHALERALGFVAANAPAIGAAVAAVDPPIAPEVGAAVAALGAAQKLVEAVQGGNADAPHVTSAVSAVQAAAAVADAAGAPKVAEQIETKAAPVAAAVDAVAEAAKPEVP